VRILHRKSILIIFLAMGVSGCKQMHHGRHKHQVEPSTQSITTQPSATASTQPVLAEQPASPEIVQQKTQAYMESLQHILAATQPAPQPQPSAPTPAPAPPPPAPTILQPEPSPPPPAVDVSVGASSPTTQSAGMNGATSSLTQHIDQQAHDQPRDITAQLDQQLLSFLRDQPVPDEAALSQLSANDRDVLSALMDGLSNYRDIVRSDPTATTTKKIQPLLDMSDRLHAAADLNIPTVALCSSVRGFGDFDAMPTDSLPAGQPIRAVVYCQVSNFASQLTSQMWTTKLTERLNLYSESNGKSVWNQSAKPITDQCKQRRHDFYCVEMIELPSNLAPGQYVLTATLEDQIANKLTQATLPISIK
jgi:hypothetical protein